MAISLFILGDSISIHYGPFLRRYLGDGFQYDRKGGPEVGEENGPPVDPANGRHSIEVLGYLEKRFRDGLHVDVLMINCGLHDLKQETPDSPCQVPVADYRRNLAAIVAIGRKMSRELVWVRTTPLQKDFASRTNRNVDAYNAAADELMSAEAVSVADLHALTAALGKDIYTDPTHFQIPARQIQAAYLAGWLRRLAIERFS